MEEILNANEEPKVWWLIRGAEKRGVYSREELKQLVAAGDLLATDQVWKEGLHKPIIAKTVNGLFAPVAPPENPYQVSPSALAANVDEARAELKPPSPARRAMAYLMLAFAAVGGVCGLLITVCALLPGAQHFWFVSGRLWFDSVRVVLLSLVAYRVCMKRRR